MVLILGGASVCADNYNVIACWGGPTGSFNVQRRSCHEGGTGGEAPKLAKVYHIGKGMGAL